MVQKPLFCFTVLTFRLSSAPTLFTKIFHPLLPTLLERLGNLVMVVFYLDDRAGCEKDFLSPQYCSNNARSDLVRAGLVL